MLARMYQRWAERKGYKVEMEVRRARVQLLQILAVALMGHPELWDVLVEKEQIGRLPEQPGVYLYFNADGDTIYDPCDNCPAVSNGAQSDVDLDGVGDPCDACLLWDDPADCGGGIVDSDLDGIDDRRAHCLTLAVTASAASGALRWWHRRSGRWVASALVAAAGISITNLNRRPLMTGARMIGAFGATALPASMPSPGSFGKSSGRRRVGRKLVGNVGGAWKSG